MACYGEFAKVYDELMSDVNYDAWAAFYLAAFSRYGKNVQHIADVACGTGNITTRLARAGLSVIGIDIADNMLRIAQEKARKQGLTIPFVCQNASALSLHKPVDAVVCACDGVNYLLSEEEVQGFFSCARHSLKKDGLLIFDMSTPYKFKHILDGKTYGEDRGHIGYLWQNHVDWVSRLCAMALTVFQQQKEDIYHVFRENHVQRVHEKQEMEKWLTSSGFEILEILGDFIWTPCQETDQRLHIVAKAI